MDGDFLREMIGFMAQRLMDFDVEGLCGAGHGERSEERTNQRNGYRDRRWETRAGSIPLRIPKLRQGSYFPGFLEPRRASEKAMTAVIQEAFYEQLPLCKVLDRPAVKVGCCYLSGLLTGAEAPPASMGSANPRPCTFTRSKRLAASFGLGGFRSNLIRHHARVPTQPW